MANHLFLPLISPLLAAALAVIFTRQQWHWLARSVVVTSITFNLGYSLWLIWLIGSEGRQVAQASNWIAPFGITIMADGASAIMLCVSSLLMLVTVSYSLASLDPGYENFFYYPLLLLLLLGVSGAFLAGDIFNLYVWFEVLLISSFGLITLGGSRPQLEGGLKYVVLNLIGSTAFLIACGMLYGTVGTLNMAHVAERMQRVQNPSVVTAIACLFFFAYGSKAAILPLFFWLPTSYHTPPAAVTAIFSGLLTKVGAYSLYRILGQVFQGELVRLAPYVLLIAGLTMLVGVFGAMAQMHVRRILSFHIVSQIGYTIMGLGLASAAGLAAGLLFTAHVMIVKTALFFIGGAAEQIYGTGDLKQMGGLARREPVLAFFWFLGILSLAGIPPMSGFFGKLALLQVGINQEAYLISGVAAFTGILTFFSMLKIWNEVFWKKAYADISKLPRVTLGLLLPGAILVVISLALGLGAGALVDYTNVAGEQLFDRAGYVISVCGKEGCEAAFEAALR